MNESTRIENPHSGKEGLDSPQKIEINGLLDNPALARRVALSVWRECLNDPEFRFTVLSDLSTLFAVYGAVEPVYSSELAARLIPCSIARLRELTNKHKDVLRPATYQLVKNANKENRKRRLYFATDIIALRQKVHRRGFFTGSAARVRAKRARFHARQSEAVS